MRFCTASIMFFLGSLTVSASDYQISFESNGSLDYTLNAVSSPAVFDGDPGTPDPTLTLEIGSRYAFTIADPSFHPIQFIARGSTAFDDEVLLSQGATLGSMESDVEIQWLDDGLSVDGTVEFTLTQELADAMNLGGDGPGYRCQLHFVEMRGRISIAMEGEEEEESNQELDNPIAESIPQGNRTIRLEPRVTGLPAPLGAVFPNDGLNNMWVYDQTGVIYAISAEGAVSTLIDLSSRLVPLGIAGPNTYDERGLLGMALHPDFHSDPRVFTYTSEPIASGTPDFEISDDTVDHHSVIAQWTVTEGAIEAGSRVELLRVEQPQLNHNGGCMRFGPDNHLYISFGDGGNFKDAGPGHGAGGNGQNLATIQGTVLRIDVNGGGIPSANGNYGIPADNPFVGAFGIDEIYAYGFRNPYSFSFDSATGNLYLGDAGENDIEEVNLVEKGANYGWNLKEGAFLFHGNGNAQAYVSGPTEVPGLTDPFSSYDHDDGVCVIGGFVNRNSRSSLEGVYIAGDFGEIPGGAEAHLYYLDPGSSDFKAFRINSAKDFVPLYLKGFAQDLDGNVYICASAALAPSGTGGGVFRIVSEDPDLTLVHPRYVTALTSVLLVLIALAIALPKRLMT